MNDLDQVYINYGSDPQVNEYITWVPCKTRNSTKAFLKMNIDKYDKESDFYGWAIELDGEVIGTVAIFDVNEELESGELGYSIGSKWSGNGIVTEAAKAVIDFAFQEVGFHRIYASHHEKNIASGIVMEKIGMKYEGIIRDGTRSKGGEYNNLISYSIIESDR